MRKRSSLLPSYASGGPHVRDNPKILETRSDERMVRDTRDNVCFVKDTLCDNDRPNGGGGAVTKLRHTN